MQFKSVEVRAECAFLSAFMQFDGFTRQTQVAFDLLERGSGDDEGADVVREAVREVFETGATYSGVLDFVMPEGEIPLDWLQHRLEQLEKWMESYDQVHTLD